MKKTQPTLQGILCLVPLMSWHHAAAAPITFTTPSNISGESDVSATGTALAAFDWSNNAQTVNDVPFTTATVNNGAVGPYITLATFGSTNGTAFTSTTNPFNSLSPSYKSMLQGSVYNSTTGTTATVSLNGLTSGHQYLVQAWVSDPRSGGPSSRIQTITGSGPGFAFDFNSVNGAGGLGQFANGYFTGDGSASTFTLSSTGSSLPQLNAIQLRDITGVWSGTVNGNWDDTTTNFSGLDFTAAKALRDAVYFGDRDAFGNAVATSELTIASGGVTGANVVFSNNSVPYTVHNAGVDGFTGPHSLTLSGAGTVTLTGAHSHTGGTVVRAGTLALGGNDRLPTTGNLTFAGPGTLSLDSNSQTLASLLFPTQANSAGVVTGATGSLTVNGAANLQVGPGGELATNYSSSLSLAGLGSFTYDSPGNIFRTGLQGGAGSSVSLGTVATVTLAQQNLINANLLAVGDIGGSRDGGISTLRLGTANDIRTSTINVGASDRSDATLEFAAAGSAATLRGPGGGDNPVANFNVGRVSTFSTAAQQAFTSSANFSNGTLDALVTSMNVGMASAGSSTNRSGTVASTVTMGAGTLNVGSLNLGRIEGTGSIGAAFGGSGTFTLNHADGIVNADTITLATNTITASGSFTKSTSGIFNLTDGTLVPTTVQRGAQTGTAGSVTAQLNWQNGTIRNRTDADLTIGSGIDMRLASTGTHTLLIDDGHTATIGAAIGDLSGGGSIIKDGPGTAIFSGPNSYSGSTTVNAGTLRVTGTLGATGVLLPAGRFSMENQAAGALNISSLAQTGGDLELDVGNSGADLLTVTGAYARSAGEIRLKLYDVPPAGPVSIVSYGVLGGTPPVSVPDSRFTATPSYGSGTSDQISVTFSGSAATLTWTGANGSAWDLNSTPNWLNGGSPDVFKFVDQVAFSDGATNTSPVLAGTIVPGSVTFTNNTDTYTLSGAGIAGAGGLTKSGSGLTVLANNNTFTGTTTVTNGTLQIGDGGNSGTPGAGSVVVNAPATLQFFRADNPVNIANSISGDGALEFLGTGLINQSSYQMTADNSAFSGTVHATDSRVSANNINALGSADIEIEDGAALYLPTAGIFANDVWITGNGWPENAGILGAIRLQNGVNAAGVITLTGPARIAAHGSTGTLSGQLVQAGGDHDLEFANTSGTADSTITLADTLTSTRTGPTWISNSIVVINTNQGFGSGTLTVAGPVRSGRIRLGNGVNVSNPVVLDANVGFTGRGVIEVAGTDAATWSGSITANAQPTAGGTFYTEAGASLTLTGPITGDFVQRDGNVTYAGGGSYTSMAVSGLAKVGANDGLSTEVTPTLGNSGGATLDLNGFNQTIAGLTKGPNAATVVNNGAADSTLTVNGDIDSNFGGTIVDGPTNTITLVKTGTSVLTLAGSNTYSGPTTVTAGALLVNGSLGNTVVSATGTLGGSGIIGAPVTIQSGGTLAPGAGAGTLTTGDLVFKPGTSFAFEIANPLGTTAGTDWDLLDATGITFENTPANPLTIRISDLGESFAEVNKTFVIASTTGVMTGFNAAAVQIDTTDFSGTGTWSVQQNGSAIELVYVAGALPPYQSWALNNITVVNPAAPSGFDDDADGDGILNGLEWILGGNPLGADGSPLVGVTATQAGGLVLTFKRADDSVGQATLAVEWDTDLGGGFAHSTPIVNPIPPSGDNPVVDINSAASPDVVTVTIPAANAGPGGKIFARLKALMP